MDERRQLTLNEQWLKRLQQDFKSASITDDEMCNALREIYESCNYIADPHTSVAIAAAKRLGCLCGDESSSRVTQQAATHLQRKVVIIATAIVMSVLSIFSIVLFTGTHARHHLI